MRLALDVHGVIDTRPVFFMELSRAIYRHSRLDKVDCEVHVLTGSRLGDGKIKKWLDDHDFCYSHLFSIADYMKAAGYPELDKSTEDNPWFRKEDWDKVKADYCRRNEIDLCLDDCDAYFKHFSTPIARYYSKDEGEL